MKRKINGPTNLPKKIPVELKTTYIIIPIDTMILDIDNLLPHSLHPCVSISKSQPSSHCDIEKGLYCIHSGSEGAHLGNTATKDQKQQHVVILRLSWLLASSLRPSWLLASWQQVLTAAFFMTAALMRVSW